MATYRILCGPALAFMAACAVQRPAMPALDVPASFELKRGDASRWPAQDWYREFGSDELNALIDAAVQSNTDLEGARARIVQADARARQAGVLIQPNVQFNGATNFVAGHSSKGGGHEFDWSTMLAASYEVDVAGKNRALKDSAGLKADAARADQDALALTMLGGVADAYFQLLAVRERLAVANANRDAAQSILDAIQARYKVSAANAMELAAQSAELNAAQIAVSDLRKSEVEARIALSVLVGKPPEGFVVEGQPLDALREPVVSPGIPAELLLRRPDVFLAELNLRASHADLVAARAAFFPTVTLTASGGLQNPALAGVVKTIEGMGPSMALGANLVQTIFDHGKLEAQRDEVQGRDQELLSEYRAAILAALGDVEKALLAVQQLDAARDYYVQAVAQNETVLEGARARYQNGAADLLGVLNAEKALFVARDALIQYKVARFQVLVSLCKALGGGWSRPGETTVEKKL